MAEILVKQRIMLEEDPATVTFVLHESAEEQYRPYGLCEILEHGDGTSEQACAAGRFATKAEAKAIAEMLAAETVTPVTLNEVI